MTATESLPVIAGLRARLFRYDKRKNLVWILTVVCGLTFMGIFSLILPNPGLFQADSSTYIDFSPNRTAGYPLLLSLLARFDPTYELLPVIQRVILVVSVAFLVGACHRVYQSAITWTLVGFAILMNPFLWRYTGMTLTESLYTSACAFFLASIMMAIKNRPYGNYSLLAAGLFVGIAISIRPVGYALIAAALFGSLFWKRRFLFTFTMIMTPVVASVFALSAWNWSKHGIFATQVSGGYEAIGKVALLIPTDLPGQNHAVAAQIAKNLEPVSSRLPTSLDRSRDYYWMTYLSYNGLRNDVVFPALATAVGASPDILDRNLQPIQTQLRINELASAIAKQTIFHRPIAYFQNVLIHFVALWTYPTMSDNKEQVHLHDVLCRPEFEKVYCQESFRPVRVVVPTAVALSKDIFFTVLMLLSLTVPLVFLFGKNSSSQSAAMAVTAVCINANYALIALVEVGLPRFSIPMWPFVCVLTAQLILLSLPRRAAI
jgi:hypothetical protein